MQNAALYIRVSSEEQAMYGLSLAAQHESLCNFASSNGLTVVGTYADEGITARKKYKNRSAFMRMLDDIQQGKIDIILFIKLDRWFRNVSDYYEVQRFLDRYHVHWIATEERYDTTTANGRLNLNIRLSIAQDESDRTAERIQFVFRDKLRRHEVISGKVPLGYQIVEKHLVPDLQSISIVQNIFQHYVDTRSIRATQKYLLDTYNLYYTQTGLRLLLQNEKYIGVAHEDPQFCPPIIDTAIFTSAQTFLAQRAQRSATKSSHCYLFSGIVFCAECGKRLSAHTIRSKYLYYRCMNSKDLRTAPCKHKHHTSELKLEKWLLEHINQQFAQYHIQMLTGQCNMSPNKSNHISKIKHKMSKLKDLYLNDLLDLDTYKQEYVSLKAELNQPIPEATPHSASFQNIESLYCKLSPENKKAFWSRILLKIVIDNEDHFQVIPL